VLLAREQRNCPPKRPLNQPVCAAEHPARRYAKSMLPLGVPPKPARHRPEVVLVLVSLGFPEHAAARISRPAWQRRLHPALHAEVGMQAAPRSLAQRRALTAG
jgi:hypothetical protein